MRFIHLQEHRPQRESLSRAELAHLVSCRQVGVTVVDAGSDVFELRPGSVIGTLVWPDLAVLIRPKVPLNNIFYLLGFRPGLTDWRPETFDYADAPDLLSSMARFLESEVRSGLSYGISRGYLDRSDSLNTLRGRVAIGRQVGLRQTKPLPLECDFTEYTEDISLNQVIKAALRRVRAVSHLDRPVALALRRAEGAFSDVADVDYGPTRIPQVRFTRLNRQWEPAFHIAQMILRAESLRDEVGRIQGISFTVDMNVLFEKFIEETVKREAGTAGLVCDAQSKVHFTPEMPMRPDLILRRSGDVVAVADAKYIELEPDGWQHANMYQLLAYCTALRLRRGLLVYAGPRPLQSYRVTASGIELEVIGVDLGRAPSDVEAAARGAARRLIEHAVPQPAHAA